MPFRANPLSQAVIPIMELAPVIPVIRIDDPASAVPLAKALVAGGLRVLEVTLRTPAALEAIRAMREVPGAIVGAGMVTNPAQLAQALDAGSQFIVSPGLTEPLGKAAIAAGIAFLPGIANAGDIMRGLDMGLTHFKFFPAMAAGGLPALKALAAPFGQCRFCPTGDAKPERHDGRTARTCHYRPASQCDGGRNSCGSPGGSAASQCRTEDGDGRISDHYSTGTTDRAVKTTIFTATTDCHCCTCPRQCRTW